MRTLLLLLVSIGCISASTINEQKRAECTSFLKKMDKMYKKKRASFQLDWKLEKRKEHSHLAERQKSPSEYEKKLEKLKERRNEKIKYFLTMPAFSAEERASIERLLALHIKFLGQGNTPLENRLIEIDVEYDLKSDMVSPDAHYEDYLFCLELEKIEKMLEACEGEEDGAQYTVGLKALPKLFEEKALEEHLRSLASDFYSPRTRDEKRAQRIMQDYMHDIDSLKQAYLEGKIS